jgi:hypothetical protein
MKKDLIKPSQLAKQLGVTRQAISLAIQKEQLPTVKKDGKKLIDLNNKKVRSYIKGVLDRKDEKGRSKNQVQPKSKKPKKKSKPTKKSNKKNEKDNEIEIPPDDKIPEDILKRLDEGRLTLTDIIDLPKVIVDKIKIYEQTKQIIQKRQQERRELIPIKFVHLLFGKIYDIDVNEFMAIKTRVKSQLAKIFKTNDDKILLKAEKALDEELWDTLRRIKYEFDKFLDKMENGK